MQHLPDHLFIVNPVAGKGKGLMYLPVVRQLMDEYYSGSSYEIKLTERTGHAREIAADFVRAVAISRNENDANAEAKGSAARIYSVGGDGTLNEVINGVLSISESFSYGSSYGSSYNSSSRRPDVSIVIIPAGSGNDFIRSVADSSFLSEFAHKENFHETLRHIIQGEKLLVDAAKINDSYFINISSLGFDARVAWHTNKLKKLPLISGSMAYILGIFTTLVNYRNYKLTIDIDGMKFESNALLIAIANGRYYGGGMMPAPSADPSDGVFDVCLIEKMGRLKILKFFPLLIKGEHGSIKGVHFFKGKNISIVCKDGIALNADGEVSIVNRAEYSIIPGALKLVVPKRFLTK